MNLVKVGKQFGSFFIKELVEPPTTTGDTVVEVANPLLDKFGLKLDFLI